MSDIYSDENVSKLQEIQKLLDEVFDSISSTIKDRVDQAYALGRVYTVKQSLDDLAGYFEYEASPAGKADRG